MSVTILVVSQLCPHQTKIQTPHTVLHFAQNSLNVYSTRKGAEYIFFFYKNLRSLLQRWTESVSKARLDVKEVKVDRGWKSAGLLYTCGPLHFFAGEFLWLACNTMECKHVFHIQDDIFSITDLDYDVTWCLNNSHF